MIYHLQFFPPNVSHLSGLWEKQFQLLMQNYSNPFITVTYFHSQVFLIKYIPFNIYDFISLNLI